ncbi:hypothetical protein HB662_24140 [Roseomonas frigidaquae]|uniref:Uncharacterized protein n=1 Tax=Falsiroseomonas frigidaquae TaxID=487318 RepID=A0ABX1F694_9PROT|nr:hypothetical protein [Falsiroseomonas frigidaquae]NKE47889.1 hypothetical protein [Falsiroseomonas frigidaquae]
MTGQPPAGTSTGRTDAGTRPMPERLMPERPVPDRPVPPVLLATTPAPCLEDFITDRADDRLRDLLAFAMAVEAARPTEPEALRRKAEADLQAHAFRTLHNQVETIRLEAAKEQIGRLRRGPGFLKLVLANLLAIALVLGAAYALWLRPDLLPAGVF